MHTFDLDLLDLRLRREIGFVPIGLISFLVIIIVVKLAGYTREELPKTNAKPAE